MNIRPFNFTPHDYEAVADIWNAAYPDQRSTAGEIRKKDETRPDKIIMRRFVLEAQNAPVGFGVFLNSEDSYHPQKFWLTLALRPEHHGRGYGRGLYEHLLRELEPFRPTELFAWSREDWGRQTRFFLSRGFEEKMRYFESRLDVASFDPKPYEGLEARLAAEGILIQDLHALEKVPDYRRKIYDLHTTLDTDVPMIGPYTPPSFEHFVASHFEDERLIKGGFIVATHGDEFIGLSELWPSPADADLHTGLTGVRREARRKGVALAMKVRGVAFAKRHGAPRVRTWNASHNRGMLAINEHLGFQKRPASLDFVKILEDGTP